MKEGKKHTKAKKRLVNLSLLCCVIVFAVSTWKIIGYLTEYKKGEQVYDTVSQYITAPESKEPQEEKEEPPVIDWVSLEKINPDLAAWIFIEDTVISYPVTQRGDNEYYLHNTFDGSDNNCGCIFMDADNHSDFTSDNSILYGHNMKTGKMFGSLKYYEDEKYLKEHPYIWIITKDRSLKYEIFATYQTEADSFVYVLEFDSKDSFEPYLEKCKSSSAVDTGVEVTTEDQLLTLSTCTSDSEEGRRVVQAKLVYDEEIKNEQE